MVAPLPPSMSQCRLIKAKVLLRQKKTPIAHVSTQIGFKNPAYFLRVYKRMFGYAPSKEGSK
jgi:transcriptional regulator GlxA family with amidase domain